MKPIYYLVLLCSGLTITLTLPLDYDEASVMNARALLARLRYLANLSFARLQDTFNNQVADVYRNTYKKINSVHNVFDQQNQEMQKIARSINANIADCVTNEALITTQKVYESLNETCNTPANNLANVYMRLEYTKRTHNLAFKYNEITAPFDACLHPIDPTPYICAGIVALTTQEAQRILPAAEAQYLQLQRKLEQQIWVLSECANDLSSIFINRLQVWHSTFAACVEERITTIR